MFWITFFNFRRYVYTVWSIENVDVGKTIDQTETAALPFRFPENVHFESNFNALYLQQNIFNNTKRNHSDPDYYRILSLTGGTRFHTLHERQNIFNTTNLDLITHATQILLR